MSDDGLIPAAVVLAWVGIVSLLAMAIRHREPAPEPVTPPGRWEWGGAVVAALCGCGSLWSWYHVTGGSLNGDELISLPAWDLPAWESYLRDREFPGLLHRGVALGVGRTWGLQGLRMVHVGLWLIVALCVWWTARSTGARWSPLVAVGVFTAQAPVHRAVCRASRSRDLTHVGVGGHGGCGVGASRGGDGGAGARVHG